MGTSNFAFGNTSKVYAVLMNREETYKECSECGEIHYDYDYKKEDFENLTCCEGVELEEETKYVIPDKWEYDDFVECIRETAKNKETKYNYNEEDKSDGDRNYPARDVFSFSIDKSYGDIAVELLITAQIVSAYYEGASLDYRLEIYNGGDFSEAENDYYKTTEEDIIEDLFETKYSDHTYSEMSRGLRTILSKKAVAWAEKEVEQMKNLIEEIFTSVTTYKLDVIGTASNGETFYKLAE